MKFKTEEARASFARMRTDYSKKLGRLWYDQAIVDFYERWAEILEVKAMFGKQIADVAWESALEAGLQQIPQAARWAEAHQVAPDDQARWRNWIPGIPKGWIYDGELRKWQYPDDPWFWLYGPEFDAACKAIRAKYAAILEARRRSDPGFLLTA